MEMFRIIIVLTIASGALAACDVLGVQEAQKPIAIPVPVQQFSPAQQFDKAPKTPEPTVIPRTNTIYVMPKDRPLEETAAHLVDGVDIAIILEAEQATVTQKLKSKEWANAATGRHGEIDLVRVDEANGASCAMWSLSIVSDGKGVRTTRHACRVGASDWVFPQ